MRLAPSLLSSSRLIPSTTTVVRHSRALTSARTLASPKQLSVAVATRGLSASRVTSATGTSSSQAKPDQHSNRRRPARSQSPQLPPLSPQFRHLFLVSPSRSAHQNKSDHLSRHLEYCSTYRHRRVYKKKYPRPAPAVVDQQQHVTSLCTI